MENTSRIYHTLISIPRQHKNLLDKRHRELEGIVFATLPTGFIGGGIGFALGQIFYLVFLWWDESEA